MSGKAANSKTTARPKFEGHKLDLLRKIAIEKHGKEVATNITDKIHAVKKAVKRENMSQKKNWVFKILHNMLKANRSIWKT